MDSDRIRDDESLRNYKELKNKLEQTISKVSKLSDLREAKGLLIEVQQSFKGLKLQREDREELYNKLQDNFAIINQKINDERLNFENEAALNYFNIKNKVDEATYMVHHSRDSKETWNFLIEVQSLFKGAKLQREHRETLYARLQEAFIALKEIKDYENKSFVAEAVQNYSQLKQGVDEGIEFCNNTDDIRGAKDRLINLQSALREAVLTKEQRDELHTKIQTAFDFINLRKEEETEKNTALSETQYEDLSPKVKNLLALAQQSNDFKTIREELKLLQTGIKDSGLLWEQRHELQTILQQTFEILNERQDADRNNYTKEASENYKWLKSLVEKGLLQAEETHEYKDTREFLKKIQSEFKGIKMIKEEREELYSRLQSAFEILNTRVDEYFHTKKKNWEVRMQYKLAETNTEIHELKASIERDKENLSELEDHLDILKSSGKDNTARAGIEARIISAKAGIEKKLQEINRLEKEMQDLKDRIDPSEE
ncbi:MAG: hypothetical protein NTZ33_14255 [Bacteroidetes bacterium]|nr:hypothetical protein [Bacteroidota bacterium]